MQSLIIDGNSLNVHDISGDNLEEILISIMRHPVAENRVITQVLLNGENYSEEVPHAALEVERSSIKDLTLTTHTAEDLSMHFLEHGHFFINTLREAIPKIVEEFRLGDEIAANEHFLSFLESLHLTISMLEQAQLSMGLGDDIKVSELGSLNDFLISTAETLTNMINLQEQSDWVYLADVMEYELDSLLIDFGKFLPLLKKAGH